MISTFYHPVFGRLKLFTVLLLLAAAGLTPPGANAQTIPVGDFRDSQFRLLQLLSDSTTELSFMNRPVSGSSYRKAAENYEAPSRAWWNRPLRSPSVELSEDFTLGFYEPELKSTVNSKLPYGENNGAAWYGRGLNTELQAGFHITSEFLDFSFRPHIIYQQNRDFRLPRFIPVDRNGDSRYAAQNPSSNGIMGTRIDRPFRFGPGSYTTFDWGHSSIRFHHHGVELGFSSEPLWWGPGVQYALTLSNNAAGIPHAFLGTRDPLELPWNIGHLQLRWVWGWPRDSKYFDFVPGRYKRKRFMNGLNIVYSPSFLPNLHLGISRIIHQYIPDNGMKASDYLAIFKPFPDPDRDVLSSALDASHFEDKNALGSVYFRWVLPESNAEVYGEYYKESHNWNLRDFLMQPQHGRAYTVGAQKILESNWIDFVKINAEINSLLPTRVDEIRPQSYYYTHYHVKQGHTSRGQLLGAAIGPGSSSEYLGVEGYFKQGMAGLFVQRVAENNHLHYEWYQRWFEGGGFKDIYHHRVNLNIGITGKYQIADFLLGARMIWNKNYNYGRHHYGDFRYGWGGRPKDDIINIQYQLSIKYLFP